jgi:integrator complex subunit 11
VIPVFALGRAQELCILVDSYWEKTGLKVPMYFSSGTLFLNDAVTVGMTARANDVYREYLHWTNETLQKHFNEHNMFDFRHIKAFDMAYVDNPGPMVVFASPGMVDNGVSLDILKRLAHDPKNMIILPGCV